VLRPCLAALPDWSYSARPAPALLQPLRVIHRVRDALYVAHDVCPQAVLAEDVKDLQDLLAVQDLAGAAFVNTSHVEVSVLASGGTTRIHRLSTLAFASLPRYSRGVGKRANREGSVYQRKDGRWVASLSYRTQTGQRKRRYSYHKSRGEADDALTEMKAARKRGAAHHTGRSPRLGEYLVSWLRDSVAVSVGPKTLEGYEVACRVHIIPVLGDVKLKDLTARKIQTLNAQKMREGLSVRTRHNIHATLKRALKQAVSWGELPANPADGIAPPKAPVEDEVGGEEIKALTNDEAERLFAAARERGDRFRNLYVVAVRTGLRQGELLGLKWGDLNLGADPASLTLRRSLAARIGGGTYFTPTKRKRQRRRVVLLEEAAQALRDQRELQAEEREKARGRWRENGLVFPSTLGTPMNARNLYARHFKPLVRSAEIPDISFHDLRHTFATIMLFDWGASPRFVQEALGHSSIKITMDIYGHVMPSTMEGEVRRIQVLLSERAVGSEKTA
jgi:integrase